MNAQAKPLNHAAPGPYLGFSLQPVRLCYHLLTCEPGASVSLELLDDVAIHHTDGRVTLEQTKSALSQNPVSDLANDLWKTFANWSQASAAGKVDLDKAAFQIYVTPKRTGAFAKALSDATSATEVDKVFDRLTAKIAKLVEQPGCKPHVDIVLGSKIANRRKIAARFRLLNSDTDPIDPIRQLMMVVVPPLLLDQVCAALVGLAKEAADQELRKGHNAPLDGDAFKATARAFVRTNILTTYLPALGAKPTPEEVAAVAGLQPIFLQQLEMIDAKTEEQMRAVSDLLRSKADLARWADAGMVYSGTLDDWHDSLVTAQALRAGEVSDVHSDKDPKVRGRIVYRQCAALAIPIEAQTVPDHFVHGRFNALADEGRIGWHPDYQALLSKADE